MSPARTCSSTTPAIVGEGYRSLPEGARVEYQSEAGDKGPKAVDVRVV